MQLAHNVRHLESGKRVAKVLHSFGREDQLDRAGLAGLVDSFDRYLGVETPAVDDSEGRGPGRPARRCPQAGEVDVGRVVAGWASTRR